MELTLSLFGKNRYIFFANKIITKIAKIILYFLCRPTVLQSSQNLYNACKRRRKIPVLLLIFYREHLSARQSNSINTTRWCTFYLHLITRPHSTKTETVLEISFPGKLNGYSQSQIKNGLSVSIFCLCIQLIFYNSYLLVSKIIYA